MMLMMMMMMMHGLNSAHVEEASTMRKRMPRHMTTVYDNDT